MPIESPSFVRSFVEREVATSTSDEARAILTAGETELPLVVWARRQTAGRGRGANTWWSDGGSLTFTIALDPRAHGLRIEHEPRLALASAVAVIHALTPILPGHRLGIRWPNDIESGGRKLGGILPESVETRAGSRLLIGIGLNVRTKLDHAPADVARLATSVELLRGEPVSEGEFESLLSAILARLEPVLSAVACDDPSLAEQWNQLDTLAGEPVRVLLAGRELRGLGAGIDARGGLRLTSQGETFTLYGGQVLRDREP